MSGAQVAVTALDVPVGLAVVGRGDLRGCVEPRATPERPILVDDARGQGVMPHQGANVAVRERHDLSVVHECQSAHERGNLQ